MGLCESSNNKSDGAANGTSNKYFYEKTNLTKQNTLVLNNDVIVSDTHQNPEIIYEKSENVRRRIIRRSMAC